MKPISILVFALLVGTGSGTAQQFNQLLNGGCSDPVVTMTPFGPSQCKWPQFGDGFGSVFGTTTVAPLEDATQARGIPGTSHRGIGSPIGSGRGVA